MYVVFVLIQLILLGGLSDTLIIRASFENRGMFYLFNVLTVKSIFISIVGEGHPLGPFST